MIGKTVLTAALGIGMASGVARADVWGDWTLNDGRVTVNVFQCQGDKICANVIRLKDPNNADGSPKLDLKNKNPALRSRHLIGMPVIEGMNITSPTTFQGQIYSSDDGSYYRAYAKMNGDRLNVKGCWLVICRDLNFTRAK